MLDMIQEAGVKVFLHCWGVDAVMEGDAVRGAVFESKSGRQAILAKNVVDATGDGDVFAAAGAEFEHRSYNIGLVSRIGNLDKVDRALAKQNPKPPRGLGSATPIPGVNWVNMLGPETDGLDVAVLTRLEMNHRRFIWENLQKMRKTPGYEKVSLLETGPQLGVRITRTLAGVKTLTADDIKKGARYPDVVAVGGFTKPERDEWHIPYGTLRAQEGRQPAGLGPLHFGGVEDGRQHPLDSRVLCHRAMPPAWPPPWPRRMVAPRAPSKLPKVQAILKQQDAYLG